MTSYHSLCRLLAPLRLYVLGGGGLVDCELKAYSAGFAMLRELIAETRRASALQTAEGDDLALYEMAVGLPPRPGVEPEKRRALVAGWRGLSGGSVNRILAQLEACGLVNPTVTEGEDRALTVTVIGVAEGISPEEAWRLAADVLPAHLPAGGPPAPWDELDSQERSWESWDAPGKSWTLWELTGVNR